MDVGFETGFALPEPSAGEALDPERIYDVLILGGGPAGLSAAIYLMRKRLDTAIITENVGGQVTWTASVENYLGYRLIEGAQLVEKFSEQLRDFSVGLGLHEKVVSLAGKADLFEVRTASASFAARAIILATGKQPRRLNVPGEERLLGRGVAYCALCDAPLYKGKATAVVGGGSSGLEAAIDLAAICPRVHLLERGGKLTGDEVLREKVEGLDTIEVILEAEVVEVLGEERVKALRFRRAGEEKPREIPVEGLFVEVGLDPNSGPFRGFVKLNEGGEVEVDCRGRTSVEGVFAAGDVTSVPFKQIVIAAGDGAKAALSAHDYLLRRRTGSGRKAR